ncbi:MAG TPA: hypothetical protein EYO82_05385, partial [Gammaproteobacteria bacterium]|nr:hypothetical protein [Gammaproteobacteria bacterium]
MTGQNILLIVSDEHAREALGCYGADHVHTPNIDGLAQRGTVFRHAYTPSPICVSARACIATGTYVHQNRCWSNAQPYHGQITGWGHRLIEAGHRVVSVGKLHYRSTQDANGFDTEIMPLHVKDGIGWARGLLGRDGSSWSGTAHFAEEIGPGLCDYNLYDMKVSEAACQWLRREAPKASQKPWVLCASFVSPHYPLVVPQHYFDLYPLSEIEPPRLNSSLELSNHPVLEAMRDYLNYDDFFDADDFDQRVDGIVSAYRAETFDQRRGGDDPTEQPVFIVGMLRSGTTLVEQIAASHPKVIGKGEMDLIRVLCGDDGNGDSGSDNAGADEKDLTSQASEFLARMRDQAEDAVRIIDKTPFNFLYLGRIQLMFPGARVVHCRRDALDTGLSCFRQYFTAPHEWACDLADIGRYHRAHERLMDH